MTDLSLTRGFTADAARKASDSYRTVVGVICLLEVAAAVAMLISPRGVARLLGAADSFDQLGWVRFAGVVLAVMAALFFCGRRNPDSAKAINLLGMIGHALIGLVLILSGDGLLLPGLLLLAAGFLLAIFYFRLFRAVVMSRP